VIGSRVVVAEKEEAMHRYLLPVALVLAAAVALLTPDPGQAGSGPSLAWSPTTGSGAYDYGTAKVGDKPVQTFALTNSGGTGSGALTISVSGSTAFSITSDACTGTALGKGKSCAVTVEYAPSTAGQSETATLSASGKKSGAKAGVTLTGAALGGNTGHIYWPNELGDAIGRANLDGTGVDENFIAGASFPFGIAVDGAHVYWGNFGEDTIGLASVDGTGANPSFITGASGAAGVAVDGSCIYWGNSGADTIGRANLDGSNPNQSFITGASTPDGVAVDSG
jgi:hypothetical protein